VTLAIALLNWILVRRRCSESARPPMLPDSA